MPVPDLMPALSPDKYWETDKWTSRHALVCDLHLTGKNNNQIAELLDYTPARVSVILSDKRSHLYIAEQRGRIAEAGGDILMRLEQMSGSALDALEDDLGIINPSAPERAIRQKAAFGVLSSLGYGPVHKSVQGTMQLPADLADRNQATLDDMKEIHAKFSFVAPEMEREEETNGEDL